MARLTSGIFGPVHGKIGSVVGGQWKQTSYLRTLPQKNNQSKQPTAAQIACREKFKFMQEWLAPFYAYVTVGFRNYAKDKTEINAAFSANYRTACVGTYPDLSIDYHKVVFAKGSLPGLFNVSAAYTAGSDSVILNWERNYNDNSSFDDQIMLVVYSRDLKIADGFVGGVNRTDLTCSLKLKPKLTGKVLDVWVCAISLNGKKVSDSEYLGRVAPQ